DLRWGVCLATARVERVVRERVRGPVLRTRHVDDPEALNTARLPARFLEEGRQVRRAHPIRAEELFENELAVGADLDVLRARGESRIERGEKASPLGHV